MHMFRVRNLSMSAVAKPLAILAILVILAGARQASAGFITNLATGLDASDKLITTGGSLDAHWTVPPQAGGPAQAAQVVYPNNADYFGGWAPNGPNSAWIARDANNPHNGPAPYTFSTTFDLSGYDLSTISIGGKWAVDDNGTLALNGHLIATGVATYGSPTAFQVGPGNSFFNQGINTLSMTITFTDDYLEGVRLEGSVISSSVVPEPSSLILTGIAALTSIGSWWGKRRKGIAA